VNKKWGLIIRSGCSLSDEVLEIFKTAGAIKEGHFLEKKGDVRVFRRDFEIAPGEHVLIVDDILTTGNSLKETINAVAKQGGVVIGIGVLVDRSEENLNFNLPFFSCLRASTTVYSPQECPLCAANIPLVKPGAPS